MGYAVDPQLKIGSLCTGYGGLDMAVEDVFDSYTVWVSEINKTASVLLDRIRSVPNHGDLKRIIWEEVEQIDILTAGYPCQPFSTAGNRKGTDDPRHIWPYIKDAIRRLRPRLVILENVRGHLSLGFSGVLGDLADIGYDAKWSTFRASDVGAVHNRERIFVIAYPKNEQFTRQWKVSRLGSRPFTRVDMPVSHTINGGIYESAFNRWASIIGRPAPDPICNGKNNPVFIEWMMGLPEGHVTGQGISGAQQCHLLGNGVVPQQAAHAIRSLLCLN